MVVLPIKSILASAEATTVLCNNCCFTKHNHYLLAFREAAIFALFQKNLHRVFQNKGIDKNFNFDLLMTLIHSYLISLDSVDL